MTAFQEAFDLGMNDDPPAGPRPAGTGVPAGSGVPPGVVKLAPVGEAKGVVYTKLWVADLILDLTGYQPAEDLAARYAVEPSVGEGAFLVPMIRRLLRSLRAHGRRLDDCRDSIHAYELDADSAARAAELAASELRRRGASDVLAGEIADGWVSVGDYLLTSPKDRRADLVVGNPPYIRYDDVPDDALAGYRRLYPTMVGRGDIYVGFIEAGLRQLKDGGVLGFICADRWMRSAYGGELRRMIGAAFGVEAVIEMHDAPAFENEVAAYPAVIVVRHARQGQALVASGRPPGRAIARRAEPGRLGSRAGPRPGGEVLGGLLLSRVAQLFIEAYCVKMRGGTLRFQAQYLRRIRVPSPAALSEDLCDRLRMAFRARDASAATRAALEAYEITDFAEARACRQTSRQFAAIDAHARAFINTR
jgi:Eco57I restriction-modification methylase